MLDVWAVSKATLGFHDSIEGLTELRKAVIFMFKLYYSKRYRLKGDRHVEPGRDQLKSPAVPSQWSHIDSV